MKKVTILALPNTIATTVLGPMDVFFLAGQLWNHINGVPLSQHFRVEIISVDDRPIKCLNNVRLEPHCSLDAVTSTDLILISSVADIDRTLARSKKALNWLVDQHHQGAHIASVCTGAFFLAETGLLDGKTATTHWGFVETFRKRYPQVSLKPERLITDEGTLFCAGALAAGIDLAVYLVEKYCGHEIAVQCSKALIHDMGRSSQAPYSVFQFQKNHNDLSIRSAQAWIEDNFTTPVDLDAVAKANGMSRRTFERRFKKATGDTPLSYLQRTRVEAAKRMLENDQGTFEEISYRLGYENSGHFRELFKKYTGLLPMAYQRHFHSPSAGD